MSNIIRTVGSIIGIGLLIIGLGLIAAGVPGSPLTNNPIKINFEETYFGIESIYHGIINPNKNVQYNNYNVIDSISQSITRQQHTDDMIIKNAKQMQDASDTIWRIQQDNNQRMYDIRQQSKDASDTLWRIQQNNNMYNNPTYNSMYNSPTYNSINTYGSFDN